MALHSKRHGLIDLDHHLPGTTPSTGLINVLATNEDGHIVEINTGPIDSVPLAPNIVRRTNNGNIKVPVSGQDSDEAISKQQVDDLLKLNDYAESFIISDWNLISNYYYKDINHLLNSSDIIVRIIEGIEEVWVDHWDILSNNTIRLYVCDIPDGRFNGRCLVHKLII